MTVQRIALRFLLVIVTMCLDVLLSFAQFEAAGRVGFGRIGIFGSNEWDNGINVGGMFEYRVYPRIGLQFEATTISGVDPDPVPCAISIPCVGSAVSGLHWAFQYTGNVVYYFSRDKQVQPYLVGSVGALRSKTAHAGTFASPIQAEIRQLPDTVDTGVSIGFGGGVWAPLGERFVLRPDIRLYDSSVRSRANLGLIQVGVLVGVRW